MNLNKHNITMAAASALLIAGLGFTPVKAADLGGDCCADLEERVAELEATTARKGNRKVSLTVSGQVNRALLIWDDGDDSDAYVVDDAAPDEGSKLRFSGSAVMKPGWTAGFVIEIGIIDAQSLNVSAENDEGVSENDALETRLANWYIESDRLGRVTLGQQNSASDGITVIDLSNAHTDPVTWHNLSFSIKGANDTDTGLIWGNVAFGLEGFKGDFVRYDSPSIYGFILSTAWGEDDAWDVALRFKKEWNSFRVAAGIAYLWVGEDGNQAVENISLYPNDTEIISGSISVLHVPTGLFANFAAGEIEITRDNVVVGSPTEGDLWFIQGGIEKRFLSYGATTIYGEYGEYNDILIAGADGVFAADGDGLENDILTGSEVTRWGFGVVQNFDSAALSLYAVYQHFEADLKSGGFTADTQDWDAVITGARIKF